MPQNQGRDLIEAEPLTRITQAVASIGRAVQSGEVPQSIKDAWESVKQHISSAQTTVEKTAKKVSDTVMPKVKAEELLTNKQGPELPDTKSVKSSQPGTISQADFATKLRERAPELSEFSDSQIVNKILELRPDLIDKIENPANGDTISARIQANLEKRSRSIVDPNTWQKHPVMGQFLKAVTSAMPVAGGVGGALLATPETLGVGSIPGMAIGTGIGRGGQDLIEQALGLSDTSPMQKAGNIAMDTGIAAITPGLTEAAMHPINTLRLGAGSLAKAETALMPKFLRQLIGHSDALEQFARGGKTIDPLVRPPFQSGLPPKSSSVAERLFEMIDKDNPQGTISSAVEDLQKAAKTKELPKLRINHDGTFTNLNTGEVLDMSGKPVNSDLKKITLSLGPYISELNK